MGRSASEEKIQNQVSQCAVERLFGKAGRRHTAQLLVKTVGHLINNHHRHLSAFCALSTGFWSLYALSLGEISLCKGISRRVHIASISEGMQKKGKNEPREILGAPTIWFRCGAVCLFSAWNLSFSKWLAGERSSFRRPFL